jgi:transcriptional regulator with XRE-family HTH domain
MRTNNRIIKIIEVNHPEVSFITNKGEYRKLNINNHLSKLGIKENDFGYELTKDKELFHSIKLVDNALAWKSLKKEINISEHKSIPVFFHLDPITTIENSEVEEITGLGCQIKALRKNLKLSQEELGTRVGTNKQYISKVENNKTDIELKTLKKIFEVGLDKRLFIGYYDRENLISSFTNSILTIKFLEWANQHKRDLLLIEGINDQIRNYLIEMKIESTYDMASLSVSKFLDIVDKWKFKSTNFDTWRIQAKLIIESDWINLIKVQRAIDKSHENSKIERIAKKKIKDSIYIIGKDEES